MALHSIETRITKMLGCRYPIFLPGMSWISNPELVSAVCNAGGFGILATGPLNAEQTRAAIQEVRNRTDKPFGIGSTLLMPGAKENARVALDEKVPLINVSLGKPDWIVEEAHAYGGKVLSTVVNATHAASAIEAGADALMVTGHEAAAHGGDVTTFCLIPSIASRFPEIPIVAAGGIADGRGMIAAMNLGADGVALGSRFATTVESPLAQRTKEFIAKPGINGGSTESDTIYSKHFDGISARVLKTKNSEKVTKSPASFPVVVYRSFVAARKMNIPLWKVLPGLLTEWNKMYVVAQFGAATEAIKAATMDGDLDNEGVQFIGQSQGLIKDIPTVDKLIQRIVMEATMTSKASASIFETNNK
jgi:enoyl-[acyl-carrier protein] reductase II